MRQVSLRPRHLSTDIFAACIVLALMAAACAPFPEVVAQSSDTGPYPELRPIDELLAQADVPSDPRAPAP